MKLKLLPMLLALILLLCGCAAEEEVPAGPVAAEFSASGMHITLTDEFAEKQHVSYTACYESTDIALLVLLEEYSLFDNTDFSAQTPVAQYAELVRNSNQLPADSVTVNETDGLTWFEFTRTLNGVDNTYRAYAFKSNDGFWLFQFAARSDTYESVKDTIHGYAMSVYFDKPYISSLPEVAY